MRFAGKCLTWAAVAILVAGAAPEAPVRLPRITIPARSAAASGLRGAQGGGASRLQAPAPVLRASLAAPDAAAAPIDPGECRLACARPYYFCLAGEDAASCPQAWTRCRSACDEPAAAP
jgi:hypothetical protein